MAWVSPTTFQGSVYWNNVPQAYDEDDDSNANSDPISPYQWSGSIVLARASVGCSKIRFWASYYAAGINRVVINVWYDGEYHEVYDGAYPNKDWEEVELGGTYDVTFIKFEFYNAHGSTSYQAYLWEVDFWEVEGISRPLVGGSLAAGRKGLV